MEAVSAVGMTVYRTQGIRYNKIPLLIPLLWQLLLSRNFHIVGVIMWPDTLMSSKRGIKQVLFFVYFSLILSCSLSSWNFFLTALKATWLFDTFLCRLTETQTSVTTHPHQLSSKRYCSNVTSELVTVLLHCIGAGSVSHQLLFISVFCYSIQYQHSVRTFQLSLLLTLSPSYIHVFRRGCGRDVVDEDV